jgi:hypothetical protein
MRPARRRRAAASLVTATFAVVALLAAGCSDDDPEADDEPTPTTTAPSRDTASTTTEATGTSTETTDDGSTPDAPLTAEAATAELEGLMEEYRDALVAIREQGSLDERSLRELTRVFTASHASNEVDGLESVGGTTVIVASPEVPEVSGVEIGEATDTCASLTADIPGVAEMVTVDVPYDAPYYIRLLRAPEGTDGQAWRIDFIASSNNGLPIEEARCP